MLEVQLEGLIEFAPITYPAGVETIGTYTDFSDELNKLVLNKTRNTVDRKPTFGNAKTVKKAADRVDSVTIMYDGDETLGATGFWRLVWDTLDTPPCKLAFRATMTEEAVSETNPMYVGKVTVVDVDGGGTVGETKWQSKTWPAEDVEILEDEPS